LQRASDQPEITGLVLDGRRLRLSQAILERWRRIKAGLWASDEATRQQLEGYHGLTKMLKQRRRRI
jgi:hypothetical protein